MIDAGLSAKRLEALFLEREISGTELDGILVTHEHSDHIKGLGAISRKYNLPIYANTNTWAALEKSVGAIPEENRRIFETGEKHDFARCAWNPSAFRMTRLNR